ncbi:uncharacterized protein [Palaemon carinicauda]|uniref:uncharacterized protein n=1 Tax=Palaemon carinicauda TaxID=392227 RepID=UPI0035B5A7FF
MVNKPPSMTFVEYARLKEEQFDDWVKSHQVGTFSSLRELMCLEEFKKVCGRELKLHLKEVKAVNLANAAQIADEFVLTHKAGSSEYVVLGGFPDTLVSAPLIRVEVSFPEYSGCIELALVDCLPIPGIDGILGNDVGTDTQGHEVFPIVSITAWPVTVTTRAAAKKATEVDLDSDINCSSLVVDIDGPGSVACRNSLEFFKMLNRKSYIQTQKDEFDFELGGTEDLSKPRFVVYEGLLYRLGHPLARPALSASGNEQMVVPTKYRETVLSLAHEEPFAGHIGIGKTFQKVAKRFWWAGMKSSVKKYIAICETCQVMGKPNQGVPRAPLHPIPSLGEPFSELVVDVVGPLPRTKTGFVYVLTIMDRASRYPEAIPMRKITSMEIFDKLIDFFQVWSSRVAPFDLVFGHKIRGPLEIFHEFLESREVIDQSVNEVLDSLRSDLVLVLGTGLGEFLEPELRGLGGVEPKRVPLESVATILDPVNYFEEDEICQVSADALNTIFQSLELLESGLKHLEAPQRENILNLIMSFPNLWQDSPGLTGLLQHDVDIGDALPVKQSPYRLNPEKRPFAENEIKYMLEHDLIQPSISPWSSPVVLVKKPDGEFRMCIDYRKVNVHTKSDSFPLPRIDDCLDQIGPSKFITKLDLLKGYWQVPLSDRAREISAFATPFGLYECKVSPFGLKNAACTFQRLMNRIICGLDGVEIYIDDLVVHSNDWETHVRRLKWVFEVLLEAGLVVNLKKCEFGKAKVSYLGHEEPFIIAVDASDVGIGGVLFQRGKDGIVRPVSDYSRKLLAAERKYSTIEKETLALVRTLVHFKPYVTNFSFPVEIWTDHNPLVFIERMKGANHRILSISFLLPRMFIVGSQRTLRGEPKVDRSSDFGQSRFGIIDG